MAQSDHTTTDNLSQLFRVGYSDYFIKMTKMNNKRNLPKSVATT